MLTETLGPTALGFSVYTFLLLLRFLFRSAKLIIQLDLPAADVGRMLLYTLPNVLVLTIPMSLLFGILIAVGRLSADSELTALRASGVSLFSLYRPIMVLSALLTAVNVLLMVWAVPYGNRELSATQISHRHALSRSIEPRTFADIDGFTFYVFEIPPEDRGDWRGVFVAPPTGQETLMVARSGRVQVDAAADRLVLRLEGAQVHEIPTEGSDRYQVTERSPLDIPLREAYSSGLAEQVSASKSVRLMTLPELRAFAANPNEPPELRRLARVEVHKKFAIPTACLVFGLFAMPLGFNNRRGGHSSGFAISIGVILVYYVLLSNGEDAARTGSLSPLVAMWFPNVIFACVGLLILARRNKDRSLLSQRLDIWLRSQSWQRTPKPTVAKASPQFVRRQADRADGEVAVVLRLPRLRLPFPNAIDRYVIGRFVGVLLLTLVSGLVIYIVADLTEQIDEILENRPGWDVVFDYYRYFVLQITYDILPIIVLVATLLTFAVLSRANEVTAFKALGVSLYRLAIPALVAAGGIAFAAAVFQAEVLPATNQRVVDLKDRIHGRTVPRTFVPSSQWLFGTDGRTMYHFLRVEADKGRIAGLEVFEFDEERRIRRRIQAAEAIWQPDGGWALSNGWERVLEGSQVKRFELIDSPTIYPFPEAPAYFAGEARRPDQMRASELRSYIAALEARGEMVPELHVELQDKRAYPFASFVMALVALPFGFRLERKGALYGLGVAIVLGMVFIAAYAFFSTLGKTGAVAPWIAVWSPSALFGLFSVYVFLGVRT